MKRTILTLTLAAFILAPVLRAEDIPHPPINPALLYWQAAAQMPALTNDQAKELRQLASGQQPFDLEKAGSFLANQDSLRLVRKAANSTAPCDWGLPMEDGPAVALPHLAKLQQMSGLVLVKAESSFAEGQVKKGIEWIFVAHRLARHAGAGDILISNLVENVLETNAIRTAARHCLAWNEETRHAYAAELQALPPLHTPRDAFHGERMMVDWFERSFQLGGQSRHEAEEMIKIMVRENPAEKEALAAQMAPGAIESALAEWRGLQTQMEAALDQPWPESQPKIKALNDRVTHSSYFLVRDTIPAIASVAERWFVLATLRTMLDAALQHGSQLDEATAATYRDALEGEPLQLKKAEDGTLTLLAAQPHPAGKSLSLRLGK